MKNENLKIEYKKIDELIPYINNARNNKKAVDKVASSIKNFGMVNPILIDDGNEIIAGHTRLLACKKLGLEKVPTIHVSDLSDAEVKALRLADNKTTEFSTWDDELLMVELEALKAEFDAGDLKFDMSEFGFEPLNISEMISAQEDDYQFEEEATGNEPKSKLGDIYKLGNHRLMCGDSTDLECVKKLTGGGTIDLFITDPPYNVDYEGKTKESLKIKNDSMEKGEFLEFLCDAFKAAMEVLKDGGIFYIWHADLEGLTFRNALDMVGLNIRQCLIWNKNTMVLGRQDYQWKHEPCLYGWKDGAAHYWGSDRKQTTVINYDKPQRNGEHPTMKPVGLFSYQIQNSSRKGENVLDLFGGSGTTLIACEQLERNCYMMELDPHYVDVIIDRWEKLTGKKAELEI